MSRKSASMPLNRSNRQPRAGNRNRHRAQEKYVTLKSLHGGRCLTTQDPPVVAYQPWNQVTLAWIIHPTAVNFGDLVNQLKAQLDPNSKGFMDNVSIQMKIHSIRVWNLTGKTVALTVYDFHDSDDADQLCGMMDAGGAGLPRLGYELPLSHRTTVQKNDKNGKKLLFTVSASDKDNILSYVRLEWKFDGPVKAPNFDLDYQRRIMEAEENSRESLRVMTDQLDTLIKQQPSLLTKLIDGVVHHAAEIAPLVSDDNAELIRSLNALQVTLSLTEAGISK